MAYWDKRHSDLSHAAIWDAYGGTIVYRSETGILQNEYSYLYIAGNTYVKWISRSVQKNCECRTFTWNRVILCFGIFAVVKSLYTSSMSVSYGFAPDC